MTGPQYPENSAADDEAWLDALAGRPAPSLSAQERAEVEHLRKAWANRKARLEEQLPEVDDDFVNRLLERQAKEVEIPTSAALGVQRMQPKVMLGGNEIPAGEVPPPRRTAANRPSFVWGIAASLVLGAGVLFQIQFADQDENTKRAETMRSAPDKATVRLVDDVSASRDELVALLKQAGAVPKVRVVKSTGEVVVEVDATQAVRDILSGDPLRMYPDIQDGRITVVLRPIKPKP